MTAQDYHTHCQPVYEGRRKVAEWARSAGELMFAREVVAGCWDHRRDVRRAIQGAAERQRS